MPRKTLVVGVDEAGRGPLAGPVCCAAFALLHDISIKEFPYTRIADSKSITEADREKIYDALLANCEGSAGWDVGPVSEPTTEGSLESTMCESDSDRGRAEVAESKTSEAAKESDSPAQSAEDAHEEVYCFSTPNLSSQSPFVFSVVEASPAEIDRLNILAATLRSMTKAVYSLLSQIVTCNVLEDLIDLRVLIDGNKMPPYMTKSDLTLGCWNVAQSLGVPSHDCWQRMIEQVNTLKAQTIVKGDVSEFTIGAASIFAKVTRDRLLRILDKKYPSYQLAVHKGYPTPAHKRLVHEIGPSDVHRLSFEPCYSVLLSKKFQVPQGREEDFALIVAAKQQKKKKRPPPKNEDHQPTLKVTRLNPKTNENKK